MKKKHGELQTEAVHPLAVNLDALPVERVLEIFLEDHHKVMGAIRDALPIIAKVAEAYAEAYRLGGRIFYVGAGTSGRLGVLDAVELPPTFGVPSYRISAIIAGGERALTRALEAAEDDEHAGRWEIAKRNVQPGDLVIGISASGETPFVIGAIAEARARDAKTVGITNNSGTSLERMVDFPIVILTGPELVAGSTRLKAGTAQKIVLNMLSTAAMIHLGKVYKGYMVDLRVTNQKLRRRAERMVIRLTGARLDLVRRVLEKTGWRVKPAILMIKAGIEPEEALEILKRNGDSLRKALREVERRK